MNTQSTSQIEDCTTATMNVAQTERQCKRCGGPIPSSKRSNATYCSKQCWRSAKTARYRANHPDNHRLWEAAHYGEQYQAHQELLDSFGSTCKICGTSEHVAWHHIDPTTKRWNISRMANMKRDKVVAEIAKCQPLCWGCHMWLHMLFSRLGAALEVQ